MVENKRHVVSGIEAVIDSAHAVGVSDLWVDAEDSAEAVNQVCKLIDDNYFSPSVYTGDGDRRICIRLD